MKNLKQSSIGRWVWASVFIIMLVAACSSEEEGQSWKKQKTFVGIIKDANVVPTSFNEYIKTQIKTDRMFFVVRGLPNVAIGDSCFIYKRNDGRKYVSWANTQTLYFIGN